MTTNPDKTTTTGKIVAGADLAPKLEASPQEECFPYWCGSLPESPYEGIDIAGINFPKISETLIRRPSTGPAGVDRIRHTGQIYYLSRAQLDLLCQKLPLAVFRFTHRKPDAPKPSRENVPGVQPAPTSSSHIAILLKKPDPDLADNDVRKHATAYVPKVGDRSVCDFIYCVPALNGMRSQDERPPACITETGIRYPAEGTEPTEAPNRGGGSGARPAGTV